MDCFPVRWSSPNFDTSRGVETETLTVKPARIEFKTRMPAPSPSSGGGQPPVLPEATVPDFSDSDDFLRVRGFSVEIQGDLGKEVDTAWESLSGGELMIEMTEPTKGGDKFRTTSPGHKSVSEVTLRGAMTDGRKALCDWINETAQHQVTDRLWRSNSLPVPARGGRSNSSSSIPIGPLPASRARAGRLAGTNAGSPRL